MHTKFISADDLANRYGVSRSTIWRWVRENHLPQPLRLGGKCIRWKEADIVFNEDSLIKKTPTAYSYNGLFQN